MGRDTTASWSVRFGALFMPLWLAVAACSGDTGTSTRDDGDGDGDGDGDDGDIDGIIPPDPEGLNLDRNPDHPLVCDDPQAPEIGTTPFIRLSNAEYNNTVVDLMAGIDLGQGASLPWNNLRPGFSPDDALGATKDLVGSVGTTATVAGKRLAAELGKLGLDGCPPKSAEAEGACFEAYLDGFVKRAYRRPLRDDERKRLSDFFAKRRVDDSFADALAVVTEAVLQSPQFLYRVELGEDEADGRARLSGYEVASRLSYLLWESMPDDALFAAAAEGRLDTSKGIADELSRMLRDPRSRGLGVRFADLWLGLEEKLARAAADAKDDKAFPDYGPEAAADLREGLETFIAEALLGDNGGIKKLLSDDSGFVSKNTAWIYGVDAPDGDGLVQVALDGTQRKGLLTQPALLASMAFSEKHAPVRRGMLVLDHILCQPPPPPPNMMIPPAPAPEPVARTTRDRLIIEHEGQGGSCKSCHQIIDSVGFAFESYDAVGRWQEEEDGLPIDTSARIANSFDADGEFAGAIEMTDTLAKSEQAAQCFVQNFLRYALARNVGEQDGCKVALLTDAVVDAEGSDFDALMSTLVKTQAFRYRSAFER